MSVKRYCRKFREQIFQELKVLEEQKSKETLEQLGQKLGSWRRTELSQDLQKWESSTIESVFTATTDGDVHEAFHVPPRLERESEM